METVSAAPSTSPSRGLNTALWVVQVLLALAFLAAGGNKLRMSAEEIAQMMGDAPYGLIKFIGTVEVLGAIGLILPMALKILPKLTGFAALGLTVVMVLAVGTHLKSGDGKFMPALVLGALAAFVTWGRLLKKTA